MHYFHSVLNIYWAMSYYEWGFPGVASGKNPPANAGDTRDAGLIPGSGRSLGGGHCNHSSIFT